MHSFVFTSVASLSILKQSAALIIVTAMKSMLSIMLQVLAKATSYSTGITEQTHIISVLKRTDLQYSAVL